MNAVLLAKHTANTAGLPDEWPVETRALSDGETAALPWLTMSDGELSAHVAAHAGEKEAWNLTREAPTPLPEEVERWALHEVCAESTLRLPNLKAVIDAAITALPDPPRTVAGIRWNSKPTIRRQDPVTLQLIAGLGLTEAQADDLFRAAAAKN